MKQESLDTFFDKKELEGPYELPEGWRWVRLGDVVEIRDKYRIPIKKRIGNLGPVLIVELMEL
jgi:hypothetical protein